ncbi:MAG: DUF192 domain-containing protein [Methanocellales archaeon]|nr:DUF192 domain-containing protein [Methanocellales archaeon]MDD3291479.1 DUF192 domain-containing protein [Methanocellales archaeon]MDD5234631.1 DUF192 domain-containing protein [Methanocellales archaeon]MDD5485016.1 DUF192 domain-containing protein [Methanocellales archaeon]
MKNHHKILIGILALVTLAVLIIGCISDQPPEVSKQNQVCIKGTCFYVELATTPDERARGLMFREHLDPDKGMLFIFEEEGVHPFWMKNTLIPLDIIWISEDKEVVFISKNTQPCEADICPSINPDKKAKYVLEVNGGVSDKIGLRVGDKALIFCNY